MPELPKVMTPEEVAKHFGWSPRRVRQVIREHGLCHQVGNRVVMTEENIKGLLEVTKPPPQATATGHPLIPNVSYAELVRLRKRQQRTAGKR